MRLNPLKNFAIGPRPGVGLRSSIADSAGLSVAAPETAAWLSLVAYVRHTLTEYDELLLENYDQESARFFVAPEISAILESWGVRRRLTPED